MGREQLTRVRGWPPAFSRDRRRCRRITLPPLPCLKKLVPNLIRHAMAVATSTTVSALLQLKRICGWKR